ncbi:MAG: hypothetical protein KTR24_02145 [Saprospiraceae bacterium]|nr:hypothetical protein [Saprospiraceae bacterium]
MSSLNRAVGRWQGHVTTIMMALAICLCCFSQVHAQFNLVSGYDLSLGGSERLNEIIDVFNQEAVGPDLRAVRLHHAFRIGLQYRLRFGAIETTFTRSFNRQRIEEIDFGSTLDDLVLSHGISTYSAGFEVGKTFLIGAMMNYHRVRYEADFENQVGSTHRDDALGTRLYLGIQSGGDGNVSIALKPYVQMMWSDIDLQPLASTLTSTSCRACFERRPMYVGLAITIQNGPQN